MCVCRGPVCVVGAEAAVTAGVVWDLDGQICPRMLLVCRQVGHVEQMGEGVDQPGASPS